MTIRRLRKTQESRNAMGTQSPYGWGWNDPTVPPPPGAFNRSRAGVVITEHTALQVDVVFTALRVLSNAVIKMGDPRGFKWVLDKYGRPYKQFIQPQPKVLTNTFGKMFQYDGRRRSVISMALFGEAWWYVVERDYYAYPRTIEVLHPLFVTQERKKLADGTARIVTYYGQGSDRVVLDDENLIHIPFMAMPGAMRGLNSLEFGGVNLALALAAMEYGQRWFSQGASPSYLLSTESKLGPNEVKRIAETFLVEHSGLQAAHLPLVLDSGLKAQKISSTPDEAQYLKTLEFSRECLASFFGLPRHLVGGSSEGNTWGRTVEEQGYQLVDFTLSGYIVPLEEAHGRLLPHTTFADFNESVILRANAADKAKEMVAARTVGGKTQNEVRIYDLDLPPVNSLRSDDLDAPLNTNTTPAVGLVESEVLADEEDVEPPTTDPGASAVSLPPQGAE